MIQGAFRIGRIAGIEIRVHPTWFIIFVLITTSLVGEFAAQFPHQRYAVHWAFGLIASLLVFGSVLFHELSHSLLAVKRGHPVRGITLFVFGGVSEIEEEAHTPEVEFWVAVVGPFSSFFLAILFWAVRIFVRDISEGTTAMFYRLAVINVALGVFNLLPAFPLDGGRVLRSILWKLSGSLRAATRKAGRIGQLFGYFMIMLGIFIAFGSGNFLNGLWIGFIGWFLTNAAEASVQQMEMHRILEGVKARDIMATDYPVIAGNLMLDELVEKYILPTGSRCFVVTEDGTLTGMVSLHEIKIIPREQWSQTRVREIMKPTEQLKIATPETAIEKILSTLDEEKVNQLPVVDRQKLIGMITREHILNIIRTRMALAD